MSKKSPEDKLPSGTAAAATAQTGAPPQTQGAAEPPGAAPTPVEQPPPTPEELRDLKAKAAKAEENWQRLLRTAADFENFKKRVARERHEAIKFANESLIEKLLPVLDSFEVALASAKNSGDSSVESLRAGMALVQQQLRAVLAAAGLEEVDAVGKSFDPTVHEAIAQQETLEVPEGHVFQQLRKGYKLHGRLLRPASVIVSKKPSSQEETSAPADKS